MKIKFSVKQPSRSRSHTQELDLLGYYGIEQVIEDLDKVLEYHSLKYERYKDSYIEKWGIDKWQAMLAIEAKE